MKPTKTQTLRFRPQGDMKLTVMKERLKTGKTYSCQSYQTRSDWFPVGYGLNKKTIAKQFQKLHYLACHSPERITKKWHSAYNEFQKKHFGTWNGASMRYLNKWSCHDWL